MWNFPKTRRLSVCVCVCVWTQYGQCLDRLDMIDCLDKLDMIDILDRLDMIDLLDSLDMIDLLDRLDMIDLLTDSTWSIFLQTRHDRSSCQTKHVRWSQISQKNGKIKTRPTYRSRSMRQKVPISGFLDASSHLYKRLCLSIGRSVGWSVRRSVGHQRDLTLWKWVQRPNLT